MQAGEWCDVLADRRGGGSVRSATHRRDACATQGRKRTGKLSHSLLLPLAACGVLTACSPRIGGSEGVDSANDALRADRETLKEQLRAAELARDEWRAKAEVLAGGGDEIKSLLMAIPAVVRIEIDRRSQIELPRDQPPMLNASIVPLDGRGRFAPLVGDLQWQLITKPGEDKEPRISSTGVLNAGLVREAYRSSFLGTHYAIEAEAAPQGIRPAPGEIFVLRLVFIDAATGRQVRGEGEVEVVSVP